MVTYSWTPELYGGILMEDSAQGMAETCNIHVDDDKHACKLPDYIYIYINHILYICVYMYLTLPVCI